jgi:hypothetical protein
VELPGLLVETSQALLSPGNLPPGLALTPVWSSGWCCHKLRWLSWISWGGVPHSSPELGEKNALCGLLPWG